MKTKLFAKNLAEDEQVHQEVTRIDRVNEFCLPG